MRRCPLCDGLYENHLECAILLQNVIADMQLEVAYLEGENKGLRDRLQTAESQLNYWKMRSAYLYAEMRLKENE